MLLSCEAVANRLVPIAPGRKTSIDAILVGVDEAAGGDRGLDDRLDRPLLHVGQHVQHDLTTALDQAEEGRFVLFQRAAPSAASSIGFAEEPLRSSARRPRQPAAAPEPPPLAT